MYISICDDQDMLGTQWAISSYLESWTEKQTNKQKPKT